MAHTLGHTKTIRLERVCKRLDDGADIGCHGRGRMPTRIPNGASAYEHGERVANALQLWVQQGIAVGPLREEEIPWEDITVSPILVRLKPNGSARIIVNMSSPHNEEGPGLVNSSINEKDFEARMSSTAKFVESLARVGVGALLCKNDWNSAYKHQHVRSEDLKLQFVELVVDSLLNSCWSLEERVVWESMMNSPRWL